MSYIRVTFTPSSINKLSPLVCTIYVNIQDMASGKTCKTDLSVGIVGNEDWTRRWDVGETSFHQSKYDPLLDKLGDEFADGKNKSVFVPLCGKTHDMIWLYEHGYTVVGVELVEKAVKEFYQENNIEPEVTEVQDVGTLYKSKDGRMQIYLADLFDITKDMVGQFDVIWDSRSLVAINLVDHIRYRDLLLSLMKPAGLYLLSTFEYDPAVWPGPPHTIPVSVVESLYGDQCTIEMIEETSRAGQNISESRPDEAPKKLSSAGAAIKTSSYVYDRWHKLSLK